MNIKNCFSIDVEEFIESNIESFIGYYPGCNNTDEITKNIDTILSLLAEVKIKATFFILGSVAKKYPNVVKSIAYHGHEIGSHGYTHKRLFSMERNKVSHELEASKKILEDISGFPVLGFRAPDFSIINNNLYVLDMLAELGYIYDSSVYPFGYHDVYGIRGFPRRLFKLANGLIEFPLSTFSLLGRPLPFGGGGYFRLYPLKLTYYFIRKINKLNVPCMIYQHPYEIGPYIPIVKGLSPYRRFRHYYNCSNGYERTKNILQTFEFCEAREIIKGVFEIEK